MTVRAPHSFNFLRYFFFGIDDFLFQLKFFFRSSLNFSFFNVFYTRIITVGLLFRDDSLQRHMISVIEVLLFLTNKHYTSKP